MSPCKFKNLSTDYRLSSKEHSTLDAHLAFFNSLQCMPNDELGFAVFQHL